MTGRNKGGGTGRSWKGRGVGGEGGFNGRAGGRSMAPRRPADSEEANKPDSDAAAAGPQGMPPRPCGCGPVGRWAAARAARVAPRLPVESPGH